jgi:hypothetical protein
VDELQVCWEEVRRRLEALHADLAREEKAAPAKELEAKINDLDDEKMLIEIELAGW